MEKHRYHYENNRKDHRSLHLCIFKHIDIIGQPHKFIYPCQDLDIIEAVLYCYQNRIQCCKSPDDHYWKYQDPGNPFH